MTKGERNSNPLAQFAKLSDDQLSTLLTNPARAPFFVAAHVALDLRTLSRHKEVQMSLEALGYQYNADIFKNEHSTLLTKDQAKTAHGKVTKALPTPQVLKKSAHAANIRLWLERF